MYDVCETNVIGYIKGKNDQLGFSVHLNLFGQQEGFSMLFVHGFGWIVEVLTLVLPTSHCDTAADMWINIVLLLGMSGMCTEPLY